MDELKYTPENSEENISMEELMKNIDISAVKSGDIITARFIRKTSEGYLFDIGQKHEALAPLSENIPDELLSCALKVQVVKLSSPEHSGHTIVSYRNIIKAESLANLKEAFRNKTPVSGQIVKSIKGGYIIDLGVEAFLPSSQVAKRRGVKELPAGTKIDCLIIEASDDNIVVSEKQYVDIVRERAAAETLSKISVGDIIDGNVVSITKFGAFVDIGGIDALLHIKDISWGETQKIENILKVGQKLTTKILSIDTTTRKISVGLKQLTENPWNNVEKKYSAGMTVKCKIKNITEFGVFCELEEGVEGLLHISEIDWFNQSPNIKKMFVKGKELELKILAVDPEKNKISLSLKRLKPGPWEEISKKISVGSKVEGTVIKIQPFGAIVEIAKGVTGTLNLKNIDWMKSYKNPHSVFKTGQKLTVYVLEFDPQKETMELSLKHLTESPFEKYPLNSTIEGTVKKILPFGVLISVDELTEVVIPKNEISRKKLESIEDVLKVGDKVTALVTFSDERLKKIEASIKKYEIAQEKELLAKYSAKNTGPQLKEILEEM